MLCTSPFTTRESSGAAARLLGAIRNGDRPGIEYELYSASQICMEPFDGDSAEAERRELLDGIVRRFRRALRTGEQISSDSGSLSGCFTLLRHLQQAPIEEPASTPPQLRKLAFAQC